MSGSMEIKLAEVMWAVLGLVALVLGWMAWEWLWWRPKRVEWALRKQGLPGNPYRLFFGDVKENARLTQEVRAGPLPLFSHDIGRRIAPLIHKAINQHGKVSFTWQGPKPRVIVMEPQLIEDALSKKFGHFRKPKPNPMLKLVLTGLLSHEGEKWAKHRRILNRTFQLDKLKRQLPAFSLSCGELVHKWEERVGADGSVEIDVWPDFIQLTGDVFSRTALGSSYEGGRRLFQLQEEQAKLAQHAFNSVPIPGYWFLPTTKNIRRREIDREVRAIIVGMIEKRKKAMSMGEPHVDDLLGLLIKSNLTETGGQRNSKNTETMATEDVIEECKVFNFTGHETTSVLLTWTMILLSMHPSWQVRAREEVLRIFRGSVPDMEGLSRLKIVSMILYEVLRLYPPVTSINRRTYKPMELGGVRYPPGVMLFFPVIIIHHCEEFWGEDANEFDPERFARGVSKASKVQGVFLPFGAGPRICIAQNFALVEAKMALCMILQRFSFELSPSYIHAPHIIVTLQPQHGAQIRLRKL